MSIKLFKQAYANQIDLQSVPFKTEMLMEAFLIENPDILSISDDKATVQIIDRQIFLQDARSGRQTSGKLDLLIYVEGSSKEYLAIVELKNEALKDIHLAQLHDYLSYFSDKDKRDEILKGKISKTFLSRKYELIGILIGPNIEQGLKSNFLNGNSYFEINGFKIETFGMTLNRFIAKDRNESYLLSETFTKSTSQFNRIRYTTWEEYEAQQVSRNNNPVILEILKTIIDYFKDEKLLISDENINLTPNDISLNNPNGKRTKVFAYCSPSKAELTVYFTHLRGNPDLFFVKPHHERYKNQYFVKLTTLYDFNEKVKELLETSYHDILKKDIRKVDNTL